MKKCKIEVIKSTFHKDLADKYGCEGIGKCPMHKIGKVLAKYSFCSPFGYSLYL